MFPSLFDIFKLRYLLFWFILQLSFRICSHAASFYLSHGAFIHLYHFRNYRMPNNLLLHTLPTVIYVLGSPLCATRLGSTVLSPSSPDSCQTCALISLRYPHSLLESLLADHSGKRVWIQLCYYFILCARHVVPQCLHLCSSSPTVSGMGLSGRVITFCGGDTVQSLELCQGFSRYGAK